MTYFEDLSPYGYGSSEEQLVHVGWLGRERAFATAAPESELVEALYRLCFGAVARHRGYHVCEWCGELVIVESGERRVCLGNGEIRVGGFAAPTLIGHYVAVHRYRPPDAFVAVVPRGGGGGTELTFPQLFERKLAGLAAPVADGLRAAAASPDAFARAFDSELQRVVFEGPDAGRTAWQYLVAARTDPSSIDH